MLSAFTAPKPPDRLHKEGRVEKDLSERGIHILKIERGRKVFTSGITRRGILLHPLGYVCISEVL